MSEKDSHDPNKENKKKWKKKAAVIGGVAVGALLLI